MYKVSFLLSTVTKYVAGSYNILKKRLDVFSMQLMRQEEDKSDDAKR